MGDDDQEVALMNIIKKFDLDLSLRYAGRTKKALAQFENHRSRPRPIKSGGTTLAYRLKTSPPLYLMLSHPICRFSSIRPYKINIDMERSFLSEMALVPVYLASFNQMTVMKTHQDKAGLFFDADKDLSIPLDDTVCWEIMQADKPAELSSMNFLLLYGSNLNKAPHWIEELMKRYFLFFFWEPRGFEMSGSTHFLHVRSEIQNKVTGVLNIVKTFFVVERVCGYRTIIVANKEVKCAEIKLRGAFRDKIGNYIVMDVEHAYLDATLATEFNIEKTLQTGFINGIITEIIKKDAAGQPERLKLFQVIAEYGNTYQGLAESLLGFVCIDNFKKWDVLSAVGSRESLKIQVSHILELLIRETRLFNTIGTLIEGQELGKLLGDNWFERAMKEMDPILIEWKQRIHYVHPLIWSLLSKKKITLDNTLVKPFIKYLLDLLYKVAKRQVKNFDSVEEVKKIRQLGFNVDLEELQKLTDDIALSKFSNGYAEEI